MAETTTSKSKTILKDIGIVAVILVLIAVLFLRNDIINYVQPPEPEPPIKLPANIEMVYFNSLHDNKTASIEIWVKNTGEHNTTNVNVFLRARNQTGATFYNGQISLTTSSLKINESTTGYQLFNITKNTTKIYYTIEVSWPDGRNIYERTS